MTNGATLVVEVVDLFLFAVVDVVRVVGRDPLTPTAIAEVLAALFDRREIGIADEVKFRGMTGLGEGRAQLGDARVPRPPTSE